MSPHELQTFDLLIRLDRRRGGPVGRQLETQLRDAIRSGNLSAGSDLPSTRTFAEDLSISRGVVVRAYGQLAAEGYIELRQGANPSVRRLPDIERAHPRPMERPAKPRVRFNLRPHLPEVARFPRQSWLRATRNALGSATNADLGYIDRGGLPTLRLEIADYLRRSRGVVADPEWIVITAGTTHALNLIGRVLTQRGETRMAFENPSHVLLHAVARRAGQTPSPVAVDSEGIVVDELDGAQSVLVSPAHQFPTGVALSPDRRANLVRWARDTGGLIIEDDYDAQFRYDRAPLGALQGLSPEHVAYVGSTGKTLAPAIRLGWAVLPPSILDLVADELAGNMLHVSGIEQLTFTDFLSRGEFDRHLRRMRALYRRRRDVLVKALATQLPGFRVSGIAAGLHVVLELPSRELEATVTELAPSFGVLVESLAQHTLPGYAGPSGVIVGYGTLPEPAIPLAVEQLARAIESSAGPRPSGGERNGRC